MAAKHNYVDIRRTLECLERLLNRASNSARVNQLERRLTRACEIEENWYETMYELGDVRACHKSIRAGQLLRYALEIIARHRKYQNTLAFS
jgi:hypothetical protein